MKNLPMKRRSFALTPRQDAIIAAESERRGVQAAEIMRGVIDDWILRMEKMVPRPGRSAVRGQARMPIEPKRQDDSQDAA